MRAHFAGDVVSGTSDDVVREANRIETAEPLEERIDVFKQDAKTMNELTEFIDDVLQKAETEAIKQKLQREKAGGGGGGGGIKNGKSSQQPKEKSRQSFAMPDFKNGKVVNRARGLVVRIFDAICNCANTAAAAPAQRLKLRGKRSASTANGGGGGVDGSAAGGAGGVNGNNTNKTDEDSDDIDGIDKQKKQGNTGKDKKIKEDSQLKEQKIDQE